MTYRMPHTLGMSGFVYLISNSASANTGQGIKGVSVAGSEPGAWGAWAREARCHPSARQEQPLRLGVTPMPWDIGEALKVQFMRGLKV